MTWQDVVITLGSLAFILALLPAIIKGPRPPKSTSALTGAWLLLYAGTYATMGLLWSSVTVGVLGALWFILFYQATRPPR